MSNILLVLFNDSLGGAEQYLKMVAEYYLKQKENVYVLFLTRKQTKAWNDLESYENFHPNYSFTRHKSLGAFIIARKCYSLRKFNFKYTFTSHVHLNGFVGLLIKIGMHKTQYFIARESTSIFKRFTGLKLFFFKMQYKLGYSKVDLLICQSKYMKDQLLENLPQLNSKIQIEVFNNPVDLEKIKKVENKKAELLHSDFLYIISAGRLIEEKGFDILIDAFSVLKSNTPNLKLMILGEGKLRIQLEKQIKDLGLVKDVSLPGFIENVYPYFREAIVCVVSSRVEGFPNVLLQMMSQNNKVVSTLCAGGIENIDGLKTTKPDDMKGLAEAIKRSMNVDDDSVKRKFNEELSKRSISTFMNKIDMLIDEQPIN